MKMKLIISAVALLLTMPAAADFTLVTSGAEVALSDVRLPRNAGGTIAYKACASCDYETYRVSSDARWLINGKSMTLSDFRQRIALVTNPERRATTVTRHIESNQITKVRVTVRDLDQG